MDHEELERRLNTLGLDTSAAESHGLCCGLLCAAAEAPEETLVATLLADADPADLLVRDAGEALAALARATREAIEGVGLGFEPLLPSDEAPIPRRARGLGDWCQGFLYGVGLAGVDDKALAADTREALRDLAAIAQVDDQDEEESEEAAEALEELAEFVWVAAMLLYEDRHPRVRA